VKRNSRFLPRRQRKNKENARKMQRKHGAFDGEKTEAKPEGHFLKAQVRGGEEAKGGGRKRVGGWWRKGEGHWVRDKDFRMKIFGGRGGLGYPCL
jgi:hypothetical protein